MKLPLVPFGSRNLKKQRPLLKGSDVRHLQQILKRLGVFNKRVDGVFGRHTANSVEKFQKLFNLKQNQVVDKDDFDVLNELLQSRLNYWVTAQKDFTHSGYHNVPVSTKLIKSWFKNIPDILGICCIYDRLIVTTRHKICALDIKTGSSLWEKDIFPQAPATVSEGKIIVPCGNLEILDMYSGKIQSSYNVDSFASPAAAVNKTIYASAQGVFYALDDKHGVKWKFNTSAASLTLAAVGYDLVYFASLDRNLYCLDEKGLLYWKTKLPSIVSLCPAIWDNAVFIISCDSWIYRLNPLTGQIIIKKRLSDEEFLKPAFHRDFMMLVNYRGEIISANYRDLKVNWQIDTKEIPTTCPIVCPDTFFIGTNNGLLAFDTCDLKMKRYLEGKKIVALIQGEAGLFVATEQGLIKLTPEIL
ncbi:MAG TPA: PQQ-binding-like beta-propeller repeat protein [Thermoanaerobacterales bacterium]|jgi:outer membrane protein assembly factor BamB|nr:PQQ-binding-like beta-propeller repeat protein [Thermoanaerobacterales bacterium]